MEAYEVTFPACMSSNPPSLLGNGSRCNEYTRSSRGPVGRVALYAVRVRKVEQSFLELLLYLSHV